MSLFDRIEMEHRAIAEQLAVDEVKVFPSLALDICIGVRIEEQWFKTKLPADTSPKEAGLALVQLARDARTTRGIPNTLDELVRKTAAAYGMPLEFLQPQSFKTLQPVAPTPDNVQARLLAAGVITLSEARQMYDEPEKKPATRFEAVVAEMEEKK